MRGTAAERFWPKVTLGPPASPALGRCWLWTGAWMGHNRYGLFFYEGGYEAAHRVSLKLAGVQLGPSDRALHRCDTPLCVRPLHLFVGTQADNMADAAAKGRTWHPTGRLNGRAKLSDEDVAAIRASRDRQVDIASRYGISLSLVSKIRRGILWETP
jgi:hypothetical protein